MHIEKREGIDVIISFDLDGCVCDSDWGWLDRLRDLGWPEGEEEKYYACRDKILDPFRFLGPDDDGIILTGRPLHLREITELWLMKNGLGGLGLKFAMDNSDKSKGTNAEFRSQAEKKVAYLIENKIRVHFDDNEEVVNAMRALLPDNVVIVIHVGWHVGW